MMAAPIPVIATDMLSEASVISDGGTQPPLPADPSIPFVLGELPSAEQLVVAISAVLMTMTQGEAAVMGELARRVAGAWLATARPVRLTPFPPPFHGL